MDDFETLFDALLGVRMDWEATCERYRSSVAGHLRSGLDVIGGRPDVLALIAADVVRFTAALEQMCKCLEVLDEVLDKASELHQERVRLHVPPVDSGSPQGDGDPF